MSLPGDSADLAVAPSGTGGARSAAPGRSWALGVFVLALVFALRASASLVVPLVAAVLLDLLFSPLVRALRRWRVPPGLSAVAIVLGVVGILGGGAAGLASAAAEWKDQFPAAVKQLERRLGPLRGTVQQAQQVTEQAQRLATPRAAVPVPKVEVQQDGLLTRALSAGGELVVNLITMLVLLAFLLSSRDLFLRKLVKVLPETHQKFAVVEVTRNIERSMSRYILTFTLINAVFGAALALLASWAGLAHPLFWGVLAGVCRFVPFAGPVVGITLLAGASLLSFDTLGGALLLPAAYAALEVLQGSLGDPWFLGRSMRLNPVVILVSIAFWGWLWGMAGVLLAVPLLVLVKTVADNVPAGATLSHFLAEEAAAPRPEEAVPAGGVPTAASRGG